MDNSTRVAVVTGGASGIGRAMARYFVEQQYGHVAVLDVDAHNGPKIADELASTARARAQAADGSSSSGHTTATPTVQFVACDVSSWQSQADAFAAVYRTCGRIDVVMANAGISEGGMSSFVAEALGPLESRGDEVPSEPSMRTLNVNLIGTMYTVKLATHYMKRNAPSVPAGAAADRPATRGNIICTASNAGLYPFPTAPIYAASKFGVVGLVQALALPLARAAIQIHGLAPAVLATNIAPSKDLFSQMAMTPMSTLVRGVDEIVRGLAGEAGAAALRASGGIAEIHGEHVTFRAAHDFVDVDTKSNLENFWNLGYA